MGGYGNSGIISELRIATENSRLAAPFAREMNQPTEWHAANDDQEY